MKENRGRYLLGILVITIGISLLLEGLGIIPSFGSYIWHILTKLWPLLFIFFGLNLLISKNTTSGIIFILLGISFLVKTIFQINFFQVLWPIIIIGIGISLFFKDEEKKEKEEEVVDVEEKNIYSKTVVFSEVKKRIESKDFKGGELNVAFSEVVLDLREVQVSKDGAKLHINCAFGEVKLLVPKGCRIKSKANSILGDWKTDIEKRNDSQPLLDITGTVILGEVDIID